MAAAKLKDILNAGQVRAMAGEFAAAQADFDKAGFIREGTRGLEELELSGRAWHLAEVMAKYLPQPFAAAAEVMKKALAVADGQRGMAALRFMAHSCFVQKYGIEDFEAAMDAQYELTKRFTAEFSVRPYLERYPEKTYQRLLAWAEDESEHVRRLVSEGTRPRLPWAARLKAFQENPELGLGLLEMLKDDESEYVRRSVANHLGDIAKDHPEVAVERGRRWMEGATAERAWVVKHGLRALIKKGHRGALGLVGAGARARVTVEEGRVEPARVKLGGKVKWTARLRSTGKGAQDLLVDYVVHYVKARGGTQAKVFKLKRVKLGRRESVELGAGISLRDLTTRKHYAGEHRVELLVNGEAMEVGRFEVWG